jgi:hypothetical protein
MMPSSITITKFRVSDLYTFDLVTEEAGKGNSFAAARRLKALKDIPLAINEEVIGLSEMFIQARALPSKAIGDSLHISLCAVHGIDFLLTWNYRHIDNAETKPKIRKICSGKWLRISRNMYTSRTYGGI